jgi:hypothetical protein
MEQRSFESKMEYRLEETLTPDRIDEMGRYGRKVIYPKMSALLDDKPRDILDLVNHGLAMIDDILDSEKDPLAHLTRVRKILQQSFAGEIVDVSALEERVVADLGRRLNELSSENFLHFRDRAIGRHTYLEVLSYWDAEAENLRRKDEVLNKTRLDKLTSDIGSIVASQMLFILDTPSDPYEFLQLSRTYGFAVKLADNLCDFRSDIQRGFINIPEEDIHHVQGIDVTDGRVTRIYPDRLALEGEYAREEYARITAAFTSADDLLLRTRLRRPIWNKRLDERLCLFGRFCHTWLIQAGEFMIAEKLQDYGSTSDQERPVLTNEIGSASEISYLTQTNS